MFYRPLFALLCVSALAGCNFGRVSLGVNRDHKIPLPSVNVLPTQWEPEQIEPEVEN